MNNYCFSDISIGMKESFQKEITAEMEDMFRQISGDENPLHRLDDFAIEISNNKFKKHVSFGMLTASLFSTMAGVYLPGENSLIHSFDEISFLQPVYAGDLLTVEGEVEDKSEGLNLIKIKVKITNQDNKTVSRAKMKVLVLK